MIALDGDLEMHTRQRTGIEIRLEACQAAVIGARQNVRNPFTKRGIVGFARDVNNRGDKPVKLVPAQEQARAGAPDQVQRAHDHGSELFGRRLEQLVARPGFQEIGNRLFRVPAGCRAGRGNHFQNATANERNGPRGLIIRLSREQAQEPDFAIHAAFGVIFLHADVIAGDPAMNAAHQCGFRHDQRERLGQQFTNRRRQDQGLGIARQDVHVLIAQQAQIAAFDHDRFFRQHAAIRIGLEAILAATEEDKMVLRQPFKEGDRFMRVCVLRLFQKRQAADLRAHPLFHRFEVSDHLRNRLKRPAHALDQTARLLLGQARQVDLDHGNHAAILEAHDRVEQGPHFKALVGTFAKKGIDQEGHVRPGGFQHAATQLAGCAFGIHQDAHILLARGHLRTPGPEAPAKGFYICRLEACQVFIAGLQRNLRQHLLERIGGDSLIVHGGNSHGEKDSVFSGLTRVTYSFNTAVSNETPVWCLLEWKSLPEQNGPARRGRVQRALQALIRRLGGGTHAEA